MRKSQENVASSGVSPGSALLDKASCIGRDVALPDLGRVAREGRVWISRRVMSLRDDELHASIGFIA